MISYEKAIEWFDLFVGNNCSKVSEHYKVKKEVFIKAGHIKELIESSPIDQARNYFEELKARFHEVDYMKCHGTKYSFDEIKKLKDLYEKAFEGEIK